MQDELAQVQRARDEAVAAAEAWGQSHAAAAGSAAAAADARVAQAQAKLTDTQVRPLGRARWPVRGRALPSRHPVCPIIMQGQLAEALAELARTRPELLDARGQAAALQRSLGSAEAQVSVRDCRVRSLGGDTIQWCTRLLGALSAIASLSCDESLLVVRFCAGGVAAWRGNGSRGCRRDPARAPNSGRAATFRCRRRRRRVAVCSVG